MSGRNDGKKTSLVLIVTVTLLAVVLCAGGGYLLAGMATPAANAGIVEPPTQTPEAAPAMVGNVPLADVLVFSESKKIYDNIFVGDVNVGGMSVSEAAAAIAKSASGLLNIKDFTLKAGDETYKLDMTMLDYTPSALKIAEQAFDYARNGDINDRYKKIAGLIEKPYVIDAKPEVTIEELIDLIRPIADSIEKPAVDATITRENNQFVITKEQDGHSMNRIETAHAIMTALDKNETSADAVIDTIKAAVTYEQCEASTAVLGTFTTYFTNGAGSQNRNTNIRVASTNINNIVLNPGDIFSCNDAFKPNTYENGYRMAPTIIGGELVDSLGGGVCQVSSTLYVALLYSELEILERQNHSLKVGYMDWGFDATLAGTAIDLKFRNNTDYPVTIEALMGNTSLTVNIYGHETRPANRSLKFVNQFISSTPPAAELLTEDPTIPLGERVVKTAAKDGYKYNVFKLVLVDGKQVDKIQVNTSVYRPVRGVVLVGTGPAAQQPQQPVDQIPVDNPDDSQVDNAPDETPVEVPVDTPVTSDTEQTDNADDGLVMPDPVVTDPVVEDPAE